MQTKSTFHLHVVLSDGELIVVVAGEVDLQTTDPLRDVIVAALAARPTELLIDLSEVTFLDAAGARALVDASRAARAADATVTVRGAGPLQRQVLEIAGMWEDRTAATDDDGAHAGRIDGSDGSGPAVRHGRRRADLHRRP